MKYLLYSRILLLLHTGLMISLNAQVSLSDVEGNAFPEYELKFNVRQPDRLDATSWQFKQGTAILDAYLDTAYQPEPTVGTDFLFLIENAPFSEWDAQRIFFKQLFALGLPEGSQPEDRFFVAHFDWKVGTNPVLVWLVEDGVADAREVIDAVVGMKRPPVTLRLHRTTELFPAIDEGLRALSEKRRKDHPAAVIVFSREVQNIYNATPTESDLAALSKSYDIPVYSLGYPPTESFQRYISKVVTLVENSYGHRVEIADGSTPEDYVERFSKLMKEVNIRAKGWNYQWILSTDAKPGSGTLGIEVAAGVERSAVALPVPSYADWIWKDSGRRLNALLAGGGVVIIVTLLFFVFIRRSKKRKTAEDALRKAEVDELKSKSAQVESNLKSERDRQEREKQEQLDLVEQKQQAERIEARRSRFKEIRNKPFLIGSDGANYGIHSFQVIVGRGSEADVRISDDSVSQKHLAISFGGSYEDRSGTIDNTFYITDLGSTNGTIINGNVVNPGEAYRLNDNDLIVLGRITLIFRL